jgi:UDP-glucose 4-epimerase
MYNKNMNKVIITGSGGYIGGQVGLDLLDNDYKVVGIDRRKRPVQDYWEHAHIGEFNHPDALQLITHNQPQALVHCAGTSLVGPSMLDPGEYYHNNVRKTIDLIEHVRLYSPHTHIIFASSAATYGDPDPTLIPLLETAPTVPISPYGQSKLMIEQVLADYAHAYGLKYTAFRFFNVCGADPQARHGQEQNATHIIARVLESIRDNTEFVMNGDDFSTPDGTCIRDYVHVADIASAIRTAITTGITGVYNIGINQGISNLEIVHEAERITQTKWPEKYGPRRAGDPAMLTASADKLMANTNWQPKYNLSDMISHAWTWYTR